MNYKLIIGQKLIAFVKLSNRLNGRYIPTAIAFTLMLASKWLKIFGNYIISLP
ncbi:hypothetical protein [Aridibaculum aurantiacum]|uniref:hypothetical protein n=1 Tax=Aridibaculum aurantiacum TaxID=2810307 RepID=UPI001A974D2E|nr:hypothetical protein [Aridibaculum aurantiacum]